jgi:hypothetical protein
MSDGTYKDFLCEYPFDGSTWSFTIKARDHVEAEERIRRMCWADVKGEICAVIPASVPGAGLFVRATCWLRNTFVRGAA